MPVTKKAVKKTAPKPEAKKDAFAEAIVKHAKKLLGGRNKKFNAVSLFMALKAEGIVKSGNELRVKMLDMKKKKKLTQVGGDLWSLA